MDKSCITKEYHRMHSYYLFVFSFHEHSNFSWYFQILISIYYLDFFLCHCYDNFYYNNFIQIILLKLLMFSQIYPIVDRLLKLHYVLPTLIGQCNHNRHVLLKGNIYIFFFYLYWYMSLTWYLKPYR